uniref:Uncharacterized protein n=1 Tax=Gopherus agassizii TaxID=38772 RepID=A0A452GLI2_9SAUR
CWHYRSAGTPSAGQGPKDLLDPGLCSRSYTAGSMLGADLRRGRRRLSSSLQVPPWRPLDRARSPEPDSVQRPTTLPLCIPPRIGTGGSRCVCTNTPGERLGWLLCLECANTQSKGWLSCLERANPRGKG